MCVTQQSMCATVAMGVMSYILSCFVLSVSCGVLEKHVTKYERETVELSCFTHLNVTVEWGIRSIFQRHLQRTPKYHDGYRRIYNNFGMQKGFDFTRRYSVSEGNGYYNLTITNLNITENGEYVCKEDEGNGRQSSTQLSVYVNVSLLPTNRNSLIVVGNNVTLPCSRHSDGPVRWLYVQSEHSLQDVISEDNLIQSKYTDTATVVQTTTDYNLSLHNVQLNQSGFYICIEDGLLFFKTPVLLTVLVNVSTLESFQESTVYSGDRVTLPCHPSFNETVRWSYTRSHEAPPNVIFDQNAIDSKYMNKVTVNNDHSSRDYNLSFNAVQLNDYGWYICYIGHDDGSTFIRAVLLTVKVDVSRYRKKDRLVSFSPGGNVILPCRTNFTDLQRWLYISSQNPSQDVIASGSHVQLNFSSRVQLNDIDQTSQEYNLTLLDVQLNQTGWYICVGVDNNDDTTEHPFFLTVYEPEDSKAAPITGGIAGFLALIAIFVCIIVGRWCLSKKRSRKGSSHLGAQELLLTGTSPSYVISSDHHKVILPRRRGAVAGVTVCNKKLFVLRRESNKKIEQYDVETFDELDSIEVKELTDDSFDPRPGTPSVKSLTSCSEKMCLYLNDQSSVFRVDLLTSNVFSWRVDWPRGLSVNRTQNVLVTCYANDTIQEYSSHGNLVRSIQLQVKDPRHCVELTDGRFVVSHWQPKHSVSLVDKRGALIETCENNETTELKMNEPRYLVVINESVLVADMNNDRILLLNSWLSNASLSTDARPDARPLTLPDETQLHQPCCMYLDQSRLFVGEGSDEGSDKGRVLVFDNIDFS